VSDFQKEWVQLTKKELIDYRRFFREYVSMDFADKAFEQPI
jgi:hypothetical protein